MLSQKKNTRRKKDIVRILKNTYKNKKRFSFSRYTGVTNNILRKYLLSWAPVASSNKMWSKVKNVIKMRFKEGGKARNFPILNTSKKIVNNLLVRMRRQSIHYHRCAMHHDQSPPPKKFHFHCGLPPWKNFHLLCQYMFPKIPIFVNGLYMTIKIVRVHHLWIACPFCWVRVVSLHSPKIISIMFITYIFVLCTISFLNGVNILYGPWHLSLLCKMHSQHSHHS